ncbi:site-specific integrase [Erwinia aphidicola]|uniref:tyrosine-type recombinase/integrase n=1 Tax=Erwinia aphidicola TaxID=68334 RepID=UPI0030D4803A
MKVNYPTGVENHGGFLRIWFMYQGQRVREGLGVSDTAKNRKAAGELRASVAYSIKVGTFDYARQFPDSSNLTKFGVAREELTVGELAAKWLAIKETEISKNSHDSYTTRVKTSISLLGENKMVSGLRSESMQALRTCLLKGSFTQGRNNAVTKTGRSVAYVNTCMTDMFSMLKFAHDNGYIERNPMAAIGRLKRDKKRPDPIERDEFHRLIDSMKTRQLRNFWSLAVYTGLRHGELCALAWEDIDLKKWTLNVSRNLTKKGDFTPPKTDAGFRSVYLIEAARNVIRDQMELTRMKKSILVQVAGREYGKAESEELTFIFNPKINAINNVSNDYYAVSSISQTWRAGMIKAGLRLRKAYQSRHTYACWSLSAGANPNFIASQMGHADAQMVYQVYGAWMAENDDAQLSLMNSKLNEFAPLMPQSHTG